MGHDKKARLAPAILDIRRHRQDHLPGEIFNEFAWDALLHLFIADAASQRLTGHCLAKRTACPSSVMSRWLMYLSEEKLVVGDGDGDLSDLLTLAPAALDVIEDYLARTQFFARSFFEPGDLA